MSDCPNLRGIQKRELQHKMMYFTSIISHVFYHDTQIELHPSSFFDLKESCCSKVVVFQNINIPIG